MFNDESEKSYYRRDNVDKSFVGSINSERYVKSNLSQMESNIKAMTEEMNGYVATLKAAEEAGNKLTASQQKLIKDISVANNQVKDFNKNNNQDLEKAVQLQKDLNELRLKGANAEYDVKKKYYDLEEDKLNAMEEHLAEVVDSYSVLKQDTKDLLSHMDNAKKKYEHLKTSFNDLKSNVRDLAMVTGLDNIKNELAGKGTNTWKEVRNKVAPQLGMSNSYEWENFKNGLIGNVQQMNSNLGKAMYGADDVKNYLSKLSDLGIYDTQLAEAQLQAVIEGNKILGLSTETQAGLLKIAKRTNNSDMLNDVNNTIATLLNIQIGLSKEQLALIAEQNLETANVLSFLGNGNAEQQMIQAQAYLEANYGAGTGNAASNILKDLVQNGTNSQYYAQLGGADDILRMAQTDAGKAMVMIAQKAQKSGMANTATENAYAYNALGVDSNLMALYSSKGNGKSYDEFLVEMRNGQATAADIAVEQLVSFEDQVKNSLGLIISKLPTSMMLGLQNTFYVMAIAQMSFNAVNSIFKLVKGHGIGQAIFSSPKFAAFTSKAGAFLKGTGAFGGMVNTLAGIAGAVSLIAGGVMFIKDFTAGYKDTKKYGNDDSLGGKIKSGLAQGIYGDAEGSSSNALKNAIKWGLIGAGIGTIVPGIGNLAGFLIGGAAGLLFGGITGSIGANNGIISNAFGLVNNSKNEAQGAPIGGIPAASIGNANIGAEPHASWPWRITSPFGVTRSYTNTKGQKMNDVHNGIDLSKANAEGTPMGVNVAGVVSKIGIDGAGANYVKIKDDAGFTHFYWHLQQRSPLAEGQRVHAGQLVGLMGSTGNVTGPHLHYAITKPGGGWINPYGFITNSLFNVTNKAEESNASTSEKINETPMLSQKLISSNTLQSEAVASRYMNNYGSPDVVNSVNNGFSNLINKLDELSSRQDAQEEMLRSIVSPSSSAVYRY